MTFALAERRIRSGTSASKSLPHGTSEANSVGIIVDSLKPGGLAPRPRKKKYYSVVSTPRRESGSRKPDGLPQDLIGDRRGPDTLCTAAK